MSCSAIKSIWKGLATAWFVLCFILLFVACERYEANAAAVDAVNSMIGTLPAGMSNASPAMSGPAMALHQESSDSGINRYDPGMPVATTYALFFAALTAVGGIAYVLKAKHTPVSVPEDGSVGSAT